MSNYSQTTFFEPKDGLTTNDPEKVIYGAEVDPELDAISTAIATKVDDADTGLEITSTTVRLSLVDLSTATPVSGDSFVFADANDSSNEKRATLATLTTAVFSQHGVTASAAELNKLDGATASTAELNILDGVTATTAEINKLDGVTATTAELNLVDGLTSVVNNSLSGLTATDTELNKLDGATVSTAELNILDGVTSTTAELNLLDGVTSTTAELNILDGVTATAAEINLLDGATTPLYGGHNVTISTSAPSGGSDGDIWFVREA